jgi:hypothetical protein
MPWPPPPDNLQGRAGRSTSIALGQQPAGRHEEGNLSYPTVTRLLLIVLVLLAIAALLGGWAWDDHGGLTP